MTDPTTDYDAIVIGAGPAGSSVSVLMAQSGRRVLLLEKSRDAAIGLAVPGVVRRGDPGAGPGQVRRHDIVEAGATEIERSDEEKKEYRSHEGKLDRGLAEAAPGVCANGKQHCQYQASIVVWARSVMVPPVNC